MRFMMFVGGDEAIEVAPEISDPTAWVEEMTARGVRVTGMRLRPSEEAATVRIRNDEVVMTDGPFAETKELIGGFDLLECADMEEALSVAARHPCAKFGFVEVRPVWNE